MENTGEKNRVVEFVESLTLDEWMHELDLLVEAFNTVTEDVIDSCADPGRWRDWMYSTEGMKEEVLRRFREYLAF